MTKLSHIPATTPEVSEKKDSSNKKTASQFSQHFSDFVTNCLETNPKKVSLYTQSIFKISMHVVVTVTHDGLQRPTASQLLDHPFTKKSKREGSLKDHQRLFDRCQKSGKKHRDKNIPRDN